MPLPKCVTVHTNYNVMVDTGSRMADQMEGYLTEAPAYVHLVATTPKESTHILNALTYSMVQSPS